MAQYLDGKALAAAVEQQCAEVVRRLAPRHVVPGLAVVLIGEDPASRIYVRNKGSACARVGIRTWQHTLPTATSEAEAVALITQLNHDPQVHGILVQQPLPPQIRLARIVDAIDPAKDVDGFHPLNIGRLWAGLPGPRPCTPLGVMALLRASGVDPRGRHAVIVGRSAIVGKPLAALLLAADATVTICHSRTPDLAAQVRAAEILVAAAGRAHLIAGEWIHPGAVVIDVGINRNVAGHLVGDVDTTAAAQRAAWITPVPGGVGPMTIAMLLQNTVTLAEQSLATP